MKIMISACLLGVCCRYDGGGKRVEALERLKERYHLIPVCPEVMGGLPTPRPPAELLKGRVVSCEGKDVTACFERGANEALKLAKLFDCRKAVLKERSPSCGWGTIYDGSFSGRLVPGGGVCAKLLNANGIEIIGESAIEAELLKD